MAFDDFWKNRPRGIFTDEDYAKMAWDAAIEAAASMCETECVQIGCTALEAEGVVRRTRDALASEIRLRSNNY